MNDTAITGTRDLARSTDFDGLGEATSGDDDGGGQTTPRQSPRRGNQDTTSDYDREKLQERLAKLVGGVVIIKVGAATEAEMKEKKARVT